MKSNITELIDFSKIDILLESFNKSTGFVTAILDLDGNVLSKSGWRQICTEFHRKDTATAQNCLISDTNLANKMAEGEKKHYYKCIFDNLPKDKILLCKSGKHTLHYKLLNDEENISLNLDPKIQTPKSTSAPCERHQTVVQYSDVAILLAEISPELLYLVSLHPPPLNGSFSKPQCHL